MSKPKLTYFDFSGSRGEEVRLALWLAGVEFEDNRIAGSSWPELKPQTPYGSLPILELEGHPALGQSIAILGLIGRQHDLLPKDAWEAARHESLMCAAEDLRAAVISVLRLHPDDEDARKQAREDLADGFVQTWARHVEAQLGDGPFVASDEISVADIKLYMVSKWLTSGAIDHLRTDVLSDFPKLTRLQQAVAEHPKIVEWYSR